ncbi:MAG TPA: GNAT family N-acetyltransferase [Candidatus Acidoferrales bacterium]|nr:GNAT family N-acetyltransferase [Candidatus Acidoferrales bacterium]
MNTRTATAADAESIARLINVAFRVERFFVDRDRTDPDKIRALLETGVFLVAEDAGRMTACVYVELRGDRAYFGLLAVDPSRQNKGVGKDMVAVVEDYARAAGCRFMDMRIVSLRAELPPFYRRLGYVETGTEPFKADAEPKIPAHFINMSKPLV